MPRPGEIANIKSKSQLDFFKLIAYSGSDPNTGMPRAPKRNKDRSIKVDSQGNVRSRVNFNPNIGHPKALRGQPTDSYSVKRRTGQGVQRLGPVKVPGGGPPNQVPTPEQARQAIDRFKSVGNSFGATNRESLPDKVESGEATRNKLRRQEVKSGHKIADPIKPDGTAEFNKQQTGKSQKWRYRQDYTRPDRPFVAIPPEALEQERAEFAAAKEAERAQTKAGAGRRRRGHRRKGQKGRKRRGGGMGMGFPAESKSKSINGRFDNFLNEALGL